MTIAYNVDIASSSPINFLRVLRRWKGSVWKSVALELVAWILSYYAIMIFYRSVLSQAGQRSFELISLYCEAGVSQIPLTFILGFFVSVIIQRWTDAIRNMGYIESPSIYISSMVEGNDEESRLLRRTMGRYLCLTQVLVFRDLSISVRKRFPSLQSIVAAGIMLPHEKEKLESYKLGYDKYWVPINWIFNLIVFARKKNIIATDAYESKLFDEVRNFRNGLQMLCNYDWVQIPLIYPQVVFLSVHLYFIVCLVGRQYLIDYKTETNTDETTVVIPIFTMLQYLFYVGWMKVAEGLMNPFGEDDDDFECNFLIDKNFAAAMCIVDQAYRDIPPLQKDKFWQTGGVEPIYSVEAASLPIHPMIGSAARANRLQNTAEPEMVIKKEETNDGQRFMRSASERLRRTIERISGRAKEAARSGTVSYFSPRVENANPLKVDDTPKSTDDGRLGIVKEESVETPTEDSKDNREMQEAQEKRL